ncbi:unnamed protein product [Closterium sp. NIES-54]
MTSTLIRWLLATETTRGRRVSCLHSNRGESPQQNGAAEHRIGLVMEIARTSMIHARAPHFLWPYAVRYAAHRLNLWPRVSRPGASPTSLWTGSPGVASEFRVWGCLALVRDTPANKLSAHAIPCVFLGFPVDFSDYIFYHPPLHRFLDSRDVASPQSSSQSPQQPSALPRQATVDYGGVGAGGASSGVAGVGGTDAGGASSEGAGAEGVGAGGTSSKGAGAEATGAGGACSGGTRVGGAGTGGASSGGARPGDTSSGGVGAGGSSSEESGAGGTATVRATRPVVTRVLASLVTDPRASPPSVLTLSASVTDFAATRRLDCATHLVAAHPLSAGGESALGCDVLEDRQFELEFLAAASPHLCAMLLAHEGDPGALDKLTPRTYHGAVSGQWASQWIAATESEMASWRSTGTYVDVVPPPGTNVVDGMWIFKMKWPPGSPPVFKARYVARGFSQHEGVDFFHTFALTPKMTTFRVLLHVVAQRDYELHFLDFSTAFLQGSLHEEIWLRHPPGFTSTFPPGTQWSLRRPVYGLRQAPHEWHDTLCTTLAALGFRPSSADPSLFIRSGPTPFFVLVDDLVFATTDRTALAEVKSELQKRHTCTDLGELRRYLGLQITRDRATRTITLIQSNMVRQVLQRFGL